VKYCDEYICVCACLSVCQSSMISLELHARSLPIFCACCLRSWLGFGRSSYGIVVIGCVLLVSGREVGGLIAQRG